jgi:hypothetical protein
MKDRITAWLAILFFLAALILPLLSLGAGLITWDWKTASFGRSRQYNLWVGVAAAIGAFAFCFAFGLVLALRVERPTWPEILLPFATSIGYSVLDIIPLPIDDVVISIGGALASYGMAVKRYDQMSKWALAPTLAAALYTVVGEFVPGPVDELTVGAVAALASSIIAGVSSRRATQKVAALAAGARAASPQPAVTSEKASGNERPEAKVPERTPTIQRP